MTPSIVANMREILVAEAVLVERHGHLAIVTLNMPERRNALGPLMYPLLSRTLVELQDNMEIRALVLTGGKHFCAGGDLDGFDNRPLMMRQGMQIGHRMIKALIGGRLPVVAAVEGNAYGAGFSMAMACDFVIVDEDSTFCAAFGLVGLQPDYGLLWTLPPRVGIGMARELMLFCEPVKGVRAAEIKLADRLVEKGAVLESSMVLADRLARLPPATVAMTKSCLSRMPMPLDLMLAWEADSQSLLVHTEDFDEGIKAFAERRPARFTGR